MVTRGRTSGRVFKRISKKEGRYLDMALHEKDDTGVIIITVYKICRKGTPITYFAKQCDSIEKEGIVHS